MRARVAALASLAAAVSATAAAEPAPAGPLAGETIDVRAVSGPLSADAGAPLWDGLPAARVPLAPQRTIALTDRRANEAARTPGPAAVDVRAATDGKDLALVVEWADGTGDLAGDETDAYGDAAAVQLPLRFGPGLRLPYVGMGDPAQPVAIHLLRAARSGTVSREALAAGFGSLTRADLGGARGALARTATGWRAVLVRPLAAGPLDLRAGLVPVAFAVWDGGRAERGGNKSLSAWKVLRLPGYPADGAYEAELGWGRRPGELGDAARGKQLVAGLCAGCHVVGERRSARPGMAPELTGLGVIATPAYLRESIVDPSAVIVPGPNPARHQDRAAGPDRRGTFRPAEAFRWSSTDRAGKQVSRMPPYAALPRADVDAMVAYLMTLGAPAPVLGSAR